MANTVVINRSGAGIAGVLTAQEQTGAPTANPPSGYWDLWFESDGLHVMDDAGSETVLSGTAGTVTSVGLSLPAELTVTGSPVTSSGTLTAAWANAAQNAVLAGPSSGGAGTPAFRALVADDIPSLDAAKINSGTFDNARVNWAAPGAIGATTPAAGTFTTLEHTGSTLGFYGETPVTQPSAYTQTYATADKTLGAYTADDESAAYSGIDNAQGGAVYAQLSDLNALRTAYETLRALAEDTAQMLNAVVDDLQTLGLVG